MIRIVFIFFCLGMISSCKHEQKEVIENKNVEITMCFQGKEGNKFIDSLLWSYVMEIASGERPQKSNMVFIKGGRFDMGADKQAFDNIHAGTKPREDEFPKHLVELSDFYIDSTEVTNAAFKEFVDATGYITTAERDVDIEEIKKQIPPGTPLPSPESLKAGSLVFHEVSKSKNLSSPNDWWSFVAGASWKHPAGPGSSIEDKMNHPAVHISWYDANAYARWAGKSLPTEAEWEYASRGGTSNQSFPWGETRPEQSLANYWQGEFPFTLINEDGYKKTAPVKSFPPNGYGLYDMAGNVWEWCLDWYHVDYYACVKQSGDFRNPSGPEFSYDPYMPSIAQKVIRGGSFLCNDSYCSGYRNASRMKSSPDTGLEHTGFRCVVRVD